MRQILKWVIGLTIGYLLLIAHQFYGLEVLVGCAVAYPIQLTSLVCIVIVAVVWYRSRQIKRHKTDL